MSQKLFDDYRTFSANNDLDRPFALLAFSHVNVEDSLEPARPRRMAFSTACCLKDAENAVVIIGAFRLKVRGNNYPDTEGSRRVDMKEIEKNDYNLNISRYVSTAEHEKPIDLGLVQTETEAVEKTIREATTKHNAFLEELGLPPLW